MFLSVLFVCLLRTVGTVKLCLSHDEGLVGLRQDVLRFYGRLLPLALQGGPGLPDGEQGHHPPPAERGAGLPRVRDRPAAPVCLPRAQHLLASSSGPTGRAYPGPAQELYEEDAPGRIGQRSNLSLTPMR